MFLTSLDNPFYALFGFIFNIMKTQLTFLGFTFTLWEVFGITIVLSILGWALGKIMNFWGN